MKHLLSSALLLITLGTGMIIHPPAKAAGFGESLRRFLGSTNVSKTAVSTLSDDQIVAGLKEALAKGATNAVSFLGRTNGFFTNMNVRIPMPEQLARVEKTLRALRQDQLADDFVRTMNRAAEQAVPQAAGVLGDSIKQMTLADAKGILTSGTNGATLYFRRTSEENLREKFLPIVREATAKTGVTSSYKAMADKAGGGMLGSFVKTQMPDLDGYVTQKTLDGLFVMVAAEEARIRQNPAARTTELLQKVFGADSKK